MNRNLGSRRPQSGGQDASRPISTRDKQGSTALHSPVQPLLTLRRNAPVAEEDALLEFFAPWQALMAKMPAAGALQALEPLRVVELAERLSHSLGREERAATSPQESSPVGLYPISPELVDFDEDEVKMDLEYGPPALPGKAMP